MKISGEQDFRIKENEEQLKKTNKSLEKKIRARQEEIKKVEELYDKKASVAVFEGEDQYAQALDRNAQRVVGASKDFEGKIQGYKDQLAKTQKMVENEEAVLKDSEQTKLEGLKKNMSNSFEERYQDSMDEQKAIELNTKNSINSISLEALNERRGIESDAQVTLNALTADYSDRASSTETNLNSKLENDLKKQKYAAGKEQDELKAKTLEEMNRLKRLNSEKARIQTDQLTYMDKHQQNSVKQKNDDFKIRYEKMVEEHSTLIKSLETQLNEDMRTMVEKSASDKKLFASRLDDQFYHVQKLNPTVIELAKHVEVALEIPEHEKENFHLSAQGRNIKMTLSRKFAEKLNELDGSVNKSTRSELFTKDVSTKDILNSNKITQKYENGILSYKILKA